jgi:hypothetical protein
MVLAEYLPAPGGSNDLRLASRMLGGTGVITGGGVPMAGMPGLVGMRGEAPTMLAGGGSVLQRSGARLWNAGSTLVRGISIDSAPAKGSSSICSAWN